MTSDFRRHWQVALATLLIWCSAGLLGSIVQAADDNPAIGREAEPRAIADRLDALVEQATTPAGQPAIQGGAPETDVGALRQQLEAAQAQIALLKNVVIQALRAQSAAEEALRREQATPGAAPALAGVPDPAGAPDPTVAEQVKALTGAVARLQAEVDALHGRAPSQRVAQDAGAALDESRAVDPAAEEALAAAAEEEDAMFPGSGMGGKYEPLNQGEPPRSGPGDAAAAPAHGPIKVGEVHFNSGSAELTPGGARVARAAVARIRSMAPAKVRVVAFTDRAGDAAYNLVLSKERALSLAAMLERVGLPRDMVEVVGNGEDDVPEPTADGVAEPLNRCAGIFVVADNSPG
jgi:outer membrane protein OmpA-like peptidoglycan-associated protein